MSECLFCRIVEGQEKAWTVWEDEYHLAFLTPFPNTPGFTVLVTKAHRDSYVLSLDEAEYTALLRAARTVGLLLDRAFGNRRCGLIVEGMGINHAHVKLVPMHGIPEGEWRPFTASSLEFNEKYGGYLTSKDGPRMSDEELDAVMRHIRAAGQLL